MAKYFNETPGYYNMENNFHVSLLAQFDDTCIRGFDLEGCDQEFLEFAQGQEDCRTKWLAAEKELQVMQSRINDAKKETSKLELLNHHVTMLLKDEHHQFDMVRECVSSETNLNDAIIERLNSLDAGRYSHPVNKNAANTRRSDKLETITEVNSAELTPSERSSLSSSESSDETLELSGTVRSFRDLHRLNKQCSEWMPGGVKTVGEQTFKGLKEVSTTTDVGVFDQCLVATTTVSFSMQTGSTVASSVIESYPGGSSTSSSDATHNITVIRRHDLKRQVVVSQAETCYPCGQRIKFGKAALKCNNCGMICHVDCQSVMPRSCEPKQDQISTEKNIEAALSKK
uniref:Phorbol-ester/DAG-type domain-containing protein n=1 Tax=Daphnia galeata TaxID=27404 RepID=A0A8J2RR04_9CRUS|nr:unnamed protein product [Daphnia galeata]